MKIKIHTSDVGPQASELMEELTETIQAQFVDQEITVQKETATVPNTKGIELSEVLLTLAIGVGTELTVSLIARLAKDLIKKLFPPKDAKHLSVVETPNGIAINNNGNNNTFNITVNVIEK